MEVGFDSVIVAAIVSAVVALAILGLRELWIEPRRWQKNIQVSNLERRLEVCGSLTTLLQSFVEKAKRQTPDQPHLLENPYDAEKLEAIFERSRYLLSDELIQKWLEFIQKDKFFAVHTSKNTGHGTLTCDLREMQKIAEKEYSNLKKTYRRTTKVQL